MIPVLQGAAAAGAKMWTRRRDTLWAGFEDLRHLGALAGDGRQDGFSGEGQGREDAVRRQAVALGADSGDLQFNRRTGGDDGRSRNRAGASNVELLLQMGLKRRGEASPVG